MSGYDPEAVRFYDVAHEGAQVRAVAGATAALAMVADVRPRSVVVLAREELPRIVAQASVAAWESLPVPVVVTGRLPRFVGALDVVVALTDRGQDDLLAQDLVAADARGATVLAVPAARGPLLADIPAGAAVIDALPTTAHYSPARTLATLAGVLTALAKGAQAAQDHLLLVADAVDEEIATLAPDRGGDVNLGRQLREAVIDARVVHTGAVGRPAAQVVAQVAAVVWSANGLPSGYVAPEDLGDALAAAEVVTGSSTDIFHDPYVDGPSGLLPLKTVMWSCDQATVPHGIPVTTADDGRGESPLAHIVRLTTRAWAATTYHVD